MTRIKSHLVFIIILGLSLTTGIARAESGASVTLNLKNTDINAFITTVSQVTGKNFIVDPRVRGKVTVISSSPMSPSSLYATFLAVLEVHGFAAIPDGSATKIIPITNARQQPTQTNNANVPRDAIVTAVFKLQNASAAQLVPILRPLVPQWGHLAAYAPNNMLIVADRAANIQRLSKIIADIDQRSDQQLSIVPLKYAAASDVARVLTALAKQQKTIDPTSHPAAILVDQRTNSVLIAGDKSDRTRLMNVIAKLDIPTSNNGDTQVVYLHYADAEKLAPILKGYAQQQAKQTGGASAQQGNNSAGKGDINVLADKGTNALIITAPPKTMQMVKNVIAQLDIRRAQVLVDGIIAEVSANKASQLGLDSVIYNQNQIAAANIVNPTTLSTLSSAGGAYTSGSSASNSTLTAAAAGLIGQGLTAAGGAISSGGTSFLLLLKALKSDGNTNILSTPSLVTLDNEEAKIEVGQDVPFLTGSYANSGVSSNNGSVNPFQTYQRKDVGLKLGITPTINAGNVIRLKINLEDSSLSSGTAGASNLVTNKRTITDTVLVKSGQILVIGGLIDNQVNMSKSGVPLLSDIPLLGSLFSYRSETRSKRNLMVFIHPVILREDTDSNYYTRVKYGEIRQAQLDAESGHSLLLGSGHSPILYPWAKVMRQDRGPVAASSQTKPVTVSVHAQSVPANTAPSAPGASSSAAAPAQPHQH